MAICFLLRFLVGREIKWRWNGSFVLSLHLDDDEINQAKFLSIPIWIDSFVFFWSFHFIFVYLVNFVHFFRSFYACFPRNALNIIWIDEFCLLNEFFFFHSQSPKDWALTLYRTNCDAKLDTLIENRTQSFSPLQKENMCRGKAHVQMCDYFLDFFAPGRCVSVCLCT